MPRPSSVTSGVALFPTRTPTLPPATHTNSYALGEQEILLIEPAPSDPKEQQAWLDWAHSLQTDGRHLLAILATHHHPDHVGGASALTKALNLPLWAHQATAKHIPTPVARYLHDGEEIILKGPSSQRWQILHTPGHAPGHICLHEPQNNLLIVGDMVASVGTILIAPGDGDMAEYLRQLQRLAALDARLALPAHGDPIHQPSELFHRYIRHRLARERRVLDAVQQGAKYGESIQNILAYAYEDTPVVLHGLALLSLQAHLEKLTMEGMIFLREERYFAEVYAHG